MGKITLRGGTLLGPLPPVLVTCGDGETADIVTVAWTGIVNTVPPKTYISLRPSRYSYELIKKTREFVIHLTPASLVRAADYCGMHTGRKVDKFEKCGLHRIPGETVACPVIEEAPLALECRVSQILPLGSHDMFLSDILAVRADEDLLDDSGKLRLDRARLAAFSHGEYFELGKRIGTFGFSVRKKKKHG